MTHFERAISFTLSWEGGLVDDPRDRGGVTNHGISQRAYPRLDVRNLTRPQILDIYRRDYWDRIRGDQLPLVISLVVFDFAVHSGVARAARALQRAVHVRADGIIGPVSVRAVQASASHDTARDVIRRRSDLLSRFVQQSPDQAAFLAGWMRRTHELAFMAGRLAA